MPEETVTIPKEIYDEMVEACNWLMCLENAGVDNWQGIDYAHELKEEGK